MNQTTKQKVLSRVLACSALLVLGTTTTGSILMNVPIAHAATAANPVADKSTMRSITLTKYQATTNNDHGNTGDGNTDPSVTNKPLEGVEFTLYKTEAIDGGDGLVDPTVQKEGIDYKKTEVGKGVTDASGKIVWELGSPDGNKSTSSNITDSSKLGDGIYMVSETSDAGAKDPSTGKAIKVVTPTNPFFVQVPQTSRDEANPGLIYDVNVQPKNVIENDINPVKTIDGKSSDSLVAGNDFSWELTTNVPKGLYEIAKDVTKVPVVDADGNQLYNADHTEAYFDIKAGDAIYFPGGNYFDKTGNAVAAPASASYTIKDTLNKDLTYKSSSMGSVDKGGKYHEFSGSLYTTNYDSKTGSYSATLTPAGIKAVGTGSVSLKDGTTYALTSDDKISTHINTTVAEGWDGVIPNNFDVTYTTPGAKPSTQTPPPGTTPAYADGGIDIKKTAGDTKKALDGAEFMIATSEDNANKNMFLASDGNSYQWVQGSTQPNLPSGVTFLTSTTKNGGIGAFDGLPLDLKDKGADGVAGTSDDTWNRDYWVVETKAPTGYELLKTPQKVTVTNTTSDDSTIELNVVDEPKTNLPFTGGRGMTLMITFALVAIAGGTAIVIVDKKRKSKENS